MRRLTIAALLLITSISARAAEWFKLGDAEFSSRLLVTVENPADTDNPAALMNMPMSELKKHISSAGPENVAVADEDGKVVPYEFATQSDGDHVVFVFPVKAHESK
jgi:hypothetical protein